MPNTRKKVIKTVYKDDSEEETGDFSDSGSDAYICEESSSEDDGEIDPGASSGDDFKEKTKKKKYKPRPTKPTKFVKTFINKINKQISAVSENENTVAPALFTVKDLTEEDKLLPSILNLSESDSSDDESPAAPTKRTAAEAISIRNIDHVSDEEDKFEYKDVWSNNMKDNSEEIAKKTFMELEQHKSKIEETKASIQNYMSKTEERESDVKDLLALGEEAIPQNIVIKKKVKSRKRKDDSDSDVEDWEEVKESKTIPQQGLQLFVEFPDSVCRKKKTIDVEMMMKRKINRVKKEHQVYMHKVHVLCWLAHGNYVSRVLNDQELLAAVLHLVPSKDCYPGERVDMKYLEQITTWFKEKLTIKQAKNEDKFKPKAPPLKDLLSGQIRNRVVTSQKYLVFIFIAMLRALGLQCRVMFNLVTLPMKPPTSELCSLSTKLKDEKVDTTISTDKKEPIKKPSKATSCKSKANNQKLAQVDGNNDNFLSCSDFENIMQVDGNNDALTVKTRSTRTTRAKNTTSNTPSNNIDEGVSPPKRSRQSPDKTTNPTIENCEGENLQRRKTSRKKDIKIKSNSKDFENKNEDYIKQISPKLSLNRKQKDFNDVKVIKDNPVKKLEKSVSLRKTRSTNKKNTTNFEESPKHELRQNNKIDPPEIVITGEKKTGVSSKYFDDDVKTTKEDNKVKLSRKRSHTADSDKQQKYIETFNKQKVSKARTKSAPGNAVEKSKYFSDSAENECKKPKITSRQAKKKEKLEDNIRVSHRDLTKSKSKPKNDVTSDLVDIIKNRIRNAKSDSKKGIVKEKQSDEDSDFLPEQEQKCVSSDSDDDFKPIKISPKPSTSRHIDRRVLSSSEETINKNKIDVWCEVFVEELEQWICIDITKGKIHDTNNIYSQATHPVCYIIGWDNNNYLKDLTRRYVPHWNTVTRKLRADPIWWDKAVQPWLGPKTARDMEENEYLDKMQLEAPLPKSIAEYKNHPLYALKRHLLKFEALYPPDAVTLGFVRREAVYSRDCVYTCRSRDTWLKEAKVVKLGEKPYKVVKARPKWDKLSNKLITDKPLEVFGPWQVQDYEPPVAENGMVPRNAYGNVELFKDCMLPKGTVHIKLPGLNKVARKLNIDCAPAMTGFDFNGGWSHPVYDGFVVCKEYEEVITEAWVKDQEEQERRELERIESRVYGNWRKLIKGLLIRERIKNKYGFEGPSTSQDVKHKSKAPRLVVKKRI